MFQSGPTEHPVISRATPIAWLNFFCYWPLWNPIKDSWTSLRRPADLLRAFAKFYLSPKPALNIVGIPISRSYYKRVSCISNYELNNLKPHEYFFPPCIFSVSKLFFFLWLHQGLPDPQQPSLVSTGLNNQSSAPWALLSFWCCLHYQASSCTTSLSITLTPSICDFLFWIFLVNSLGLFSSQSTSWET